MIRWLLAISLLVLLCRPAPAQTVLVSPYVQPGDGSSLTGGDVKALAWITDQKAGDFVLEYASAGGPLKPAKVERTQLDFALPKRKPAATPALRPGATPNPVIPTDLESFRELSVRESAVPTPEKEQHYFKYSGALRDLPLDSTVHYRVRLGAKLVGEGVVKTRASAGKPIRFVAAGDLADGKPPQNSVAWQIAQQKPDFMIALGDIVYPQGRVSQYLHHFWPTYNGVATASSSAGAPIFGTMPLYPVVGNHDMEQAKLPDFPDAWGAYYFFAVPQNGPGLGAWNLPLGKDKAAADLFRSKVGAAYPSLNIYSWDDGPAHFVAFDSSGYVNPDNPELRAWLKADLRGSRQPWKFVCMHTPAFHASREHYTEQKMRLLEPLFDECGVDVIFAGHVHNYQRSKPLHFTPVGGRDPRGRYNGDLRLDEKFDGVKNTAPDGIIHIVSGGGGATLYGGDLAKIQEALKLEHGDNFALFTSKYVARHSFSLVDLNATTFTLRQIASTGEEIDEFTITKARP